MSHPRCGFCHRIATGPTRPHCRFCRFYAFAGHVRFWSWVAWSFTCQILARVRDRVRNR